MAFAQRRNVPLVRARRGVTLIELIVVLAIIGIAAGVAGLTMDSAGHRRTVSEVQDRLSHARDSALTARIPVTIVIAHQDTLTVATAFPDGRVVSTNRTVDRLTGSMIDASVAQPPYATR